MIIEFQGEFRWLSNFTLVEVRGPVGLVFKSTEHAYQAFKSLDESIWKNIQLIDSPGKVKIFSRGIKIRDDWNEVKQSVMYYLVRQKFNPINNFILSEKLIKTNGMKIQEGNYHSDKYWGFCLKTNKGKNILGQIIELVRKDLMNYYNPDSNNFLYWNNSYIENWNIATSQDQRLFNI